MDLLSTGDNSTLLNTFNNDNVESTLRVLKSLGLDNWISLDLSIVKRLLCRLGEMGITMELYMKLSIRRSRGEQLRAAAITK